MAKAKKAVDKVVEAPKKDSRMETLEARVQALEDLAGKLKGQFGLA